MFAFAPLRNAARTGLYAAARPVARASTFRTLSTAVARPQFSSRMVQQTLPRFYSAAAGLDKETITARIMDVIKSFEKVDATKLATSSDFAQDLGLDSLDAVEVVMAIEEEFAIEIPDAEADEIKTVQQAIDYISKTPEAH